MGPTALLGTPGHSVYFNSKPNPCYSHALNSILVPGGAIGRHRFQACKSSPLTCSHHADCQPFLAAKQQHHSRHQRQQRSSISCKAASTGQQPPEPPPDLNDDTTASSTSSTTSTRSSSSSINVDVLTVHALDGGNASLQVTPPALAHPAVADIARTNEETAAANRLDMYKAIAISGAVSILAGLIDHEWVEAHQGLSMTILFCLGYVGIMVEELVGLNKAGVALLMAVSLWTIRSTSGAEQVDVEAAAALASVSELIFFLLGAMTVVEVVDSHGGFKRLASWVVADERTTLAWGVGLLSFAMSAVLDNLTTTIVMISILQRAIPSDPEFRRLLGAVVVIAANAGGAWTPIGDVTTTMLWIHGQITPLPTMQSLLLPSFVSLGVPLALLCAVAPELQGPVTRPDTYGSGAAAASTGQQQQQQPGPGALAGLSGAAAALQGALAAAASTISGSRDASSSAISSRGSGGQQQVLQEQEVRQSAASGGNISTSAQPVLLELNRDILVLSVGVGALLFVPLFKYLTGLPPYMGMLSGLAVLWMVTDALHFGEDRQYPRVQDALRNLDIAGVMFFMGILMSVEALNSAGLLAELATALNKAVPNVDVIAGTIGIVSAFIDNVPLVAATMGMYDLNAVPVDSQLWQLIALCAGTGGSLLVIGSAAGVAYMGMEGVGFGWYFRTVTPVALLGYLAAITSYVVMHGLPSSAA